MNCNCTAKRNDIEEDKQMETSRNAGFSLVEVMLSMAILAILTISLLNYFATSLAYNTKMASDQKATLLAQEVIEGLKGQDTLIQSQKQVQPDGTSRDVYTIPYLLSKNYKVVPEKSSLDAQGRGTISFKGDATDIGKKYDVTVDVSSGESAWDKTKNMYGFDNTNSILAVDENQDENALLYFKPIYSSKLSDAQIKEKIKRTIEIEINKDISETEYTVNVKYVYIATGLDTDNSSSNKEKTENILSDVKISELKKVFILYHTFNQEDHMIIKNGTADMNIPDTLYLVAQKKTADETLPANYKMYVTGLNMAKLYSNVGTGKNKNSSEIWKKTSDADPGAVTVPLELPADEFADVHTVDFVVSVYEKGKAGQTGAKPYITINGTKGEKP